MTAPKPFPSGFVVSIVLVLSIAAFVPSLRFGYVQDDVFAIERNAVVARGDLREILASDYWKGTPGSPDPTLYRPVTVASFALERAVTGTPSPALSHATNLALHAVVSLLLFAWARRIGGMGAPIAALLFAVHPVHTSAVANLVGRNELLATGFSLGALLALDHAEPRFGAGWRRLAAWSAALLGFLALGSKETAFALPVLALLQEALVPRARKFVERAAMLAPLALAVVVYFALRTRAIEAFPGHQVPLAADNLLVALPPLERSATALAMVARYAGLLVWPVGLSGDYSGSAIAVENGFFSVLPLAGAAILAGLAALLVLGFVKRQRPAARAAALAAGAFLFPYLVVGNLLVPSGAGFAARLLYFPSVGFCLLVGLVLEAASARRRGRIAVVGAVSVSTAALLAGSLREVREWRSDEALLRAAMRDAPGSVRAPLTLARMAADAGRNDEALTLLETALEAWPEHGPAWLDYGIVLARRGDIGGAERALRRAADISPDVAEVRALLGVVLASGGKDGEAERELKRALVLDRGRLDAAEALGDLRYRQGRFAEAAHFYRGCVILGGERVKPKLELAERRAVE